MDQGAFAESAEVHGNLYGTLKSEVERVLSGGRHVLLDVDIQGASLLRRAFPSVVTIFILPPSGEVMLDRPFGQCGCGSTDLEWLSGEELKIQAMEVA